MLKYSMLFLQVEEFAKSIDVSQYKLFRDNQVFVIWDWAWLDDVEDGEQVNSSNDEDGDDASTTNHQLQSDDDESDNTDEPVVPPITHSVVFKCIGANKEKRYQELLALASKKLKDGQTVPVQLKKEPTNCFDSRAIAFMCKADKEWERIGYVVSEALPDVHNAMDADKILAVRFDRIMVKVYYKNPGWYAGIIITLNGTWSKTVCQSCSTFK